MRFPPRLHILLARDAPYGLIIRRGPAKVVCTIGWNRANDTFQLGQWLRGRIYEYRCDLSPDGRHFLYFALTGRWSSETKGSYSAISRAPYLKAISLYPQGDTWGGGGVFLDHHTFTLYGSSVPLRADPALTQVPVQRWVGGPHAARLERDGWLLSSMDEAAYELPGPCGWNLRLQLRSGFPPAPGRGCHWEEYALVHATSGRVHALPDFEWVGIDGARLVWSSAGTLNAARFTSQGLDSVTQLADFNALHFERRQAPY